MSKKRCHFCEDFAMLKSKGDTPSEIKSVYLATLVRKLIVNGRVKRLWQLQAEILSGMRSEN